MRRLLEAKARHQVNLAAGRAASRVVEESIIIIIILIIYIIIHIPVAMQQQCEEHLLLVEYLDWHR